MILRSSGKRQWAIRLAAAAFLVFAAYAVASRLVVGAVVWDPLVPECHRFYLIFGALLALFAWETRPEEVAGDSGGCSGSDSCSDSSGEDDSSALQLHLETTTEQTAPKRRVTERTYVSIETPKPSTPAEALYAQARTIRHASPPNVRTDGRYLQLLKDAVDAGSRPAMVKFGQYAMRRGTCVEAYYWFTRAKAAGEPEMDKPIADAIKLWKKLRCRDQSMHTYRHFTPADYHPSAQAMRSLMK